MKKSLLLASLLFPFIACKKDSKCDDSVTYNNQVKPIINATCAVSTCHDGDPSSAAPGDYRTFTDIKTVIDNGKFKNRVLTIKDMPPSYSPGPKTLTQDQLDQIQCWADQGFKEK
ncbi:MAG: hypothetical protein KGS48_14530 [Bacteroidetes bacterium]|nr:hypothetical protein [Bacteroidota bacterium]